MLIRGLMALDPIKEKKKNYENHGRRKGRHEKNDNKKTHEYLFLTQQKRQNYLHFNFH